MEALKAKLQVAHGIGKLVLYSSFLINVTDRIPHQLEFQSGGILA